MKSNLSQQKFMLIQSMKKLVNHILQSPIRQRDIFNSLSKNDLMKIVTNLNDQNITLRKNSAQLLCSLVYQNDTLKQQIIKLLGISPVNGRINFNKFPQFLLMKPIQFKYCLELIKQPIRRVQMTKMCWIVDLSQIDKKMPQISFLDFERHITDSFPDPKKALFGFTYFIQLNEKRQKINSRQKSIQRKRQKSTSRSKIANTRNKGRPTGYLANFNKQQKISNNEIQNKKQQKINHNRTNKFSYQDKKSSNQFLHVRYIKPVSNSYISTSQKKTFNNRKIGDSSEVTYKNTNNLLNNSITLPIRNQSFEIQSIYKQQIRKAAFDSVKVDFFRKQAEGDQGSQKKYQPNIVKTNNFTNHMKFSYIPMANRANPNKQSITQRPSSSLESSYLNSNQNNRYSRKQTLNIQQGAQYKTLKSDQSQTTKSNSHNFMLKSFQFDSSAD